MRESIADICICYAVGALWTLAFESPVSVFENIVFGRVGGERKNREAKKSNDMKVDQPSTSAVEAVQIQN